MHSTIAFKALLFACSLSFCFVLGEIGIRSLGWYDMDGNFLVRNRALKPYHLPITSTRERIRQYVLSFSESSLMYDPVLGWAPKPNGASEDGLYNYNSLGVRPAHLDYPFAPRKDILRIAIFGDSFTHGDEVPFENTWGYYLENKLRQNGIKAEIINFGVRGYGMDQAFLRWREFGCKYSPHIVIFGLQMENLARNINLIRPIFIRDTGIPFSKPRFILRNGILELINSPTISPENLPNVIEHLNSWEFVKYEHFFRPEDYSSKIWNRSRLITLGIDILTHDKSLGVSYDLAEEGAQITLKIIDAFKQSVEARNGRFILVHLPMRSDIVDLISRRHLVYAELLEKIQANNHVIQTVEMMVSEAKRSSLDGLFSRGLHYSAEGNEIVARAIEKSFESGAIRFGN